MMFVPPIFLSASLFSVNAVLSYTVGKLGDWMLRNVCLSVTAHLRSNLRPVLVCARNKSAVLTGDSVLRERCYIDHYLPVTVEEDIRTRKYLNCSESKAAGIGHSLDKTAHCFMKCMNR